MTRSAVHSKQLSRGHAMAASKNETRLYNTQPHLYHEHDIITIQTASVTLCVRAELAFSLSSDCIARVHL